MTKESLQEYCDKEGTKVKILHLEKLEDSVEDEYWVVYTYDLDYKGRESYDTIVEPEYDEIIIDEKEFKDFAAWRLKYGS